MLKKASDQVEALMPALPPCLRDCTHWRAAPHARGGVRLADCLGQTQAGCLGTPVFERSTLAVVRSPVPVRAMTRNRPGAICNRLHFGVAWSDSVPETRLARSSCAIVRERFRTGAGE